MCAWGSIEIENEEYFVPSDIAGDFQNNLNSVLVISRLNNTFKKYVKSQNDIVYRFIVEEVYVSLTVSTSFPTHIVDFVTIKIHSYKLRNKFNEISDRILYGLHFERESLVFKIHNDYRFVEAIKILQEVII